MTEIKNNESNHKKLEIILPAHHKHSQTVKNWKEISSDATEMRKMILANNFIGHYSGGFALAHSQVSNDPKKFFVINEVVQDGILLKTFKHWCIINLKIIKFGHPVSFEEACLSFPFRKVKKVNRMAKIKVIYQIPSYFGTMRKKKKELIDIAAFICQHELAHFVGKNIYNK